MAVTAEVTAGSHMACHAEWFLSKNTNFLFAFVENSEYYL